jgi:ABC-2 type transport system permease protein
MTLVLDAPVEIAPTRDAPGLDYFCARSKFLVYHMVSRNLKVKYRRSFMGLFWTLLAPCGMAAVYYVVFEKILRIQIPHYLAFILAGVFPWAFMSQTVGEGAESLLENWGLISRNPIPLQIFPFVGSATHLVSLCFAAPVMVAASLASGVTLGFSLVLIPVYFALLFATAYGFALLAAILNVYFRDLRFLLAIVMQVWFYGTPVVYGESLLSGRYAWILYANPVAMEFKGLHAILVAGAWPEPREILVAAAWAAGVSWAAAVYLRRCGPGLAERL